ncbi:hemoglobin subunit alpha-3-like isoform X2 [Hyla sarda]|uniref:hemoglobin subunit alpha-3-like isoform X2 n=1 Tax=Hyla sarda TaxID=327740 RepID=UPI0024C3763C|nr:hemoglobin subunit alpha-3-like isoform X2 [Hyla sarda]
MFSDAEKAAIVSILDKASGNVSALGAETLERMFLGFPQTKTYFNHFDLSHGSTDVQTHGGKVLGALVQAAKHLDNLEESLSKLSDLHAYNLRVDPGNFHMLSHSMLVVLAAHFPADFDAATHAAFDKFLAAVSHILTSKYR